MRNIFGSGPQSELLEFLGQDPLLVFDYDGTLCPIVQDAAQAGLRAETRSLLMTLCERSICILLTGRARADVLKHVDGIPFAQVVGSHGEDWLVPKVTQAEVARRRRKVAQACQELKSKLGHLSGVQVENKGFSLSVHYRQAVNRRTARAAARDALSALKGFRFMGGKEVFNILPKASGGKGEALIELKKMFGKPDAIYVGDDTTDEEAFALPARERIFKVRVGYSASSEATYYLLSQKKIDSFLKLLRNGVSRSLDVA